jgi:hypothetical protein
MMAQNLQSLFLLNGPQQEHERVMFLHAADEDKEHPVHMAWCSSVFGGPSLFLAFVYKDSLWRKVLSSWF